MTKTVTVLRYMFRKVIRILFPGTMLMDLLLQLRNKRINISKNTQIQATEETAELLTGFAVFSVACIFVYPLTTNMEFAYPIVPR